MTRQAKTTSGDYRAYARDMLARAGDEPLQNVRAGYEAAAVRWNAIAERQEQLDLEYAERREKLAARSAGAAA